jgi:hypothetical protein
LMANDVEIAVIRQYLETLIVHAMPLIQDVTDFERASARLISEGKSERPLIGLVAGVAFDFDLEAHWTTDPWSKAAKLPPWNSDKDGSSFAASLHGAYTASSARTD